MLGRYAVLCQALFQGTGPNNPLVESVWQLLAALQNAAPFVTDEPFQQISLMPAMANVYFASIIRAVQVRAHEYGGPQGDQPTGVPHHGG